MKPPARLFVNAVHAPAAVRGTACALLAGLLGACVGNPFQDAQVDPRSPIAAEVSRTARANTDFPSFSEIPAAPADVRPLKMFGEAARDVELAGLAVEKATAPETWTLDDTEAFAARARQQAGPEIAPAQPSDTQGYAEELRRRATPPPPRQH